MTAPGLSPDERVAATLAFLRDVLGLQVSSWQERALEKLVAPLTPPARPVRPAGGASHLGPSAGGRAMHGGPRAGCPACPPGDPAEPDGAAFRAHAEACNRQIVGLGYTPPALPVIDETARYESPLGPFREYVDGQEQEARQSYRYSHPIPDGQTWSAEPARPGAYSVDPLYCPGCGLPSGPNGQRPKCDSCTHPWHGQR